MPGILPMKVIKVGASAQSRIAQACDRCRSKKIRCDGIRPCCSQCANVGFECKTSDKLSRRAFPRGYTESLEERVRGLEAEVRELKDLLDEKDEKIDMLSRIHSHSSIPIQLPPPRRPPPTVSVTSSGRRIEPSTKDETFRVQQSQYLLTSDEGSDSYFAGTSSVRTFIEAFKHRVQEIGRTTAEIDTTALLNDSLRKSPDDPATPSSPVMWKAPPRLVSDQLINIYFQEWAPLFPVLHRPTFLTLYEKYINDSDSVVDKAAIAQLNLVFGIAALSNGSRSSADLDSFESQWKAAVDSIMAETSTPNLQALVLAQLFCIQQRDYARLLAFKGLATAMSTRLGLHQSQKRFALGTLTCETRKKIFWTLYTIDSFTAAILGLPKHLKDDDVQCEYPVDADDEYVTERGFQPTLPGEFTKLSSALALFRASRILSKVLEEVFPAKASYELSLKKLSQLSDELDAWSNSLAPHLRLQFAQDKPSAGTISSRSPLISLTYHYIRALIYRPPVCASMRGRSSPAMLTVASACKHMIQIVELLDERSLSFSFCLNRDEILVLAGFGLLFQGLTLDSGSKILKDNTKMINTVVDTLNKSAAPCALAFERVANSFLSSQRENNNKSKMLSLPRDDSGDGLASSTAPTRRKSLKAMASRLTSKTPADNNRRATVAAVVSQQHSSSSSGQAASASGYDPASISRSEPARSPINMYSRPTSTMTRPSAPPPPTKVEGSSNETGSLNLDYLSFGNEPEPEPESEPTRSPSQPIKTEPAPTDWEKLLGCLDNGDTNIYDACYGGPPVDALLDAPTLGMHSIASSATLNDSNPTWSADTWALYHTDTNVSANSGLTSNGPPDSILSFSTDESLSSGDELQNDWASASSSGAAEQFRAIVLPELGFEDMKVGGSWEVALNI